MEEILAALGAKLGAATRLERLDERPHSRILHVVREEPSPPRRFVVKQVRYDGPDDGARARARMRAETEFDALRRLEQGFDPGSRYLPVRPVACLPEHFALVMEKVEGEPLTRFLHRHGTAWPSRVDLDLVRDRCALAGAWLRSFQIHTRVQMDGYPFLSEMRSEIVALLRSVSERRRTRLPSRLAGEVFSFVDRAVGESSAVAVTGSTGEFCPGNILVRGDRMAILDFGLYRPNTALSDAALFYQHLEMFGHSPLVRPSPVAAMCRAFLEGYGQPDLAHDRLFTSYRIFYKLSRMDATSGRKWGTTPFARRLFYRYVWRLQRREIAEAMRFVERAHA